MNKSQTQHINIGEILSKRRSQLNKTITSIANETRLSPTVIEQLEKNQFQEIGNFVYARGYLTAYAKALGLDEKQLLVHYQKTNSPNEVTIKPALGNTYGRKNLQEKQTSKTVSFLVCLLAFFITLGIYFINEDQLSNWINKNKSLVSDADVKPLNIDLIDHTSGDPNNPTNDSNTVIGGDSNLSIETQQPQAAVEITTPTISEAEELLAEQNPIISESLPNENSNDTLSIELQSTQDFDDDTNDQLVSKPLSIRFNNSCWIKVIDQSDTVVISKLYQRGDSANITAKGELTILTGRPNAIEQFNYAGKNIDLFQFKAGKNKYLVTP